MNIVPIINTNDAVVAPPVPNSDLQGVNVSIGGWYWLDFSIIIIINNLPVLVCSAFWNLCFACILGDQRQR